MKWREEPKGPVIRGGLTGHKLLARVNYTGSLWRGTVWTAKGSSSQTGLNLSEIMAWCEAELRS